MPYDNGKFASPLRLQISNVIESIESERSIRSGSPWYRSPERTLIALYD